MRRDIVGEERDGAIRHSPHDTDDCKAHRCGVQSEAVLAQWRKRASVALHVDVSAIASKMLQPALHYQWRSHEDSVTTYHCRLLDVSSTEANWQPMHEE